MKTKLKEISAQDALKKTDRKKYINDEVFSEIPAAIPTTELEFFTLGKYVSNDELEKEYEQRGLVPANLQSLLAFDKINREKLDEMEYVSTQWKNAKGKYCFATFSRWSDDERYVRVRQVDGGWDVNWWFAGVRKSSEIGTSALSTVTLETLSLRVEKIENWISRVKDQLL